MRIAVMVIGSVFMIGCFPQPAGVTPLYGIPVESATPVDLAEVDAAWEDVTACWGYRGGTNSLSVEVPDDWRVCSRGNQCYPCTASKTGWCSGHTLGHTVYVTPDLAAIRHEVSHLVCAWSGGSKEMCANYSGWCWL